MCRRERVCVICCRSGGSHFCFFGFVFAADRTRSFDQLQVVINGEVEDEAVGHRVGVVKVAINENGFGIVVEAGADERRVLHALFGAESGQDTAESFGPVAWAETFALARQAHNDVRGV